MRAFFALMLVALTTTAIANTNRQPLLQQDNVTVWRTTIAPGKKDVLQMHRHEHDRILVALTDGTLKIVDNHKKMSYLKLVTGNAYYLKKDTDGSTHTDENIGKNPIKVVVINLGGTFVNAHENPDLKKPNNHLSH